MRNKNIDVLRFLGLSMIILAHVFPPDWLFQLRNFDVPLMILVSGMSFVQSHKPEPYTSYVGKRFKRLVLPVWIFLTGYFLVDRIIWFAPDQLKPAVILDSYALLEGIGFVWVIRVFLLVALTAPFVFAVNERISSNRIYLVLLAVLYLLYELFLATVRPFDDGILGQLFSFYICYTPGFSLIFALGIRLTRLTRKQCVLLGIGFLVVFLACAFWYGRGADGFVGTQKFKYPPRIYYLSYALAVSSLAIAAAPLVCSVLARQKVIESVIFFIAQNSLWIYLWHIPMLQVSYRIHQTFWVEYVMVFSGAVCMAFAQSVLIRKCILPFIANDRFKKNILALLTG